MEVHTALVLAIQLLALFSIAGALLLYLLCKVRGGQETALGPHKGGTVLITSAETALGLQLCTHFASRGCRVFAGMRDAEESLPSKLIRAWMQARNDMDADALENGGDRSTTPGIVVPVRLDVTREDVLRESIDAMGAHLNAGERGIHAIINTAGVLHRERIDTQESGAWEGMFKTNVLGGLRVARALLPLLRPTRGRIIYLGAGQGGAGLVAFTASRTAVEGCAEALREELQPFGISVLTIDSHGVPAEALFRAPMPQTAAGADAPTQYCAEVLTASALGVVERAVWDVRPHQKYHLAVPNSKFNWRMPCQGSAMRRPLGRLQKV